MPVAPILHAIGARYQKIRSGIDIGFRDAGFSSALHSLRGGVWRTADGAEDLPYEDSQFEVAAMAGDAVSRPAIREANRVLAPGGCLFFSVDAKSGRDGLGWTMPDIYKTVREGFDIVSVKMPRWWRLGRWRNDITVCARKKAWREHKSALGDGMLSFMIVGGAK